MTNKKNIKLADDHAGKAATWFIKLRDDDLPESEYLAWQEWLAESGLNAAAFADAERCWEDLDNIKNPLWPEKHSRTTNLIRRFMPIAAAILVALSIGFVVQKNISAPLTTTTYQTARAEHKNIQLEDGSEITLGARSIINVNYTVQQRNITLVRGEAVFSVAKNKARPFVVRVGKGTVTAIGTKFNIHSINQDVTVTVLEGIVEVNPLSTNENISTAALPRVSAGKAVSYDHDGHISEIKPTNVDAATSWEKGLLVRVNTPLSSVIADVNRYSSREIIIGDPSLNHISFTGTVLNDGIDNWLRGLSVAYPIKVLDSGHDAILLLKKEK